MNKRCVLFAILLCCMSLHAQFFSNFQVMIPHYYPGEVYFVDGSHEAYDEVELPRGGKSELSVKKNKEDKKRETIEAANIKGIKIWHEKFPDKEHVFYYVFAEKSSMQGEHHWGVPVAGSNWGVLYECDLNYLVDKKTGDVKILKYTSTYGPTTPTLYYLKRPEWQAAKLLLANGRFVKRKKAAELFAEKPAISEKVKEGKMFLSDMQYILDEMAGDVKTKNDTIETPSIQEETIINPNQNGVVGDDE